MSIEDDIKVAREAIAHGIRVHPDRIKRVLDWNQTLHNELSEWEARAVEWNTDEDAARARLAKALELLRWVMPSMSLDEAGREKSDLYKAIDAFLKDNQPKENS